MGVLLINSLFIMILLGFSTGNYENYGIYKLKDRDCHRSG